MKESMELNPMIPEPFKVTRVGQETDDTFTLELRSANGKAGFTFSPGQFNMLYMFGVGEIPISISGDPHTPEALVHTTRAVGAVTKAMHELKRGDILGVRGPYGKGWPIEAAEGNDIIFVAGGIGLAPLRPALYQVLNHREKYGRVILLYGTRTPQDILYRKELEHWRSRFDLEVYVTVDRAMRSWKGSVGVVTTLIQKAPFDPSASVAMVCGPEVMMRFTVAELCKRGVSEENIYLSMERNMKCAIGLCGHCQFGPVFVCKDGPVFPYKRIKGLLEKWEI
ncbi:MAG: FAD/NAD(P)-binding protein [Ignavibacteriales bacterium]|nr:FAD/NAD(P)-binding protein [Ignavibacteriales bacterium]